MFGLMIMVDTENNTSTPVITVALPHETSLCQDKLGVKGLATFKTSVRNDRRFSARRARPVKAANIRDIGNDMFDASSQPVRWCVKKRL